MTAGGFLFSLLVANIAAAAAIVVVLLVRGPVRRIAGPRMAYWLWAAPLAAGLAVAVLPPPVEVVQIVAAPASATPEMTLAASMEPLPSPASEIAAAVPIDWLAIALWVWIAGVVAAFALTVIRQVRTMREFGDMAGPAVIGLIRPRLILPKDFEERYSPRERELILIHERAHLGAGDTRANALLALMACVNWFNPLVHLAVSAARQDQELSCDAAVVARFPGERRAYAEALLKTQLAPAALPLGCTWPSRSSNLLRERVMMLARKSPGRAGRAAGALLVATAAAGAGIAAWAAQPERQTVYLPAPDGGRAGVAEAQPPTTTAPNDRPSPEEAQKRALAWVAARQAETRNLPAGEQRNRLLNYLEGLGAAARDSRSSAIVEYFRASKEPPKEPDSFLEWLRARGLTQSNAQPPASPQPEAPAPRGSPSEEQQRQAREQAELRARLMLGLDTPPLTEEQKKRLETILSGRSELTPDERARLLAQGYERAIASSQPIPEELKKQLEMALSARSELTPDERASLALSYRRMQAGQPPSEEQKRGVADFIPVPEGLVFGTTPLSSQIRDALQSWPHRDVTLSCTTFPSIFSMDRRVKHDDLKKTVIVKIDPDGRPLIDISQVAGAFPRPDYPAGLAEGEPNSFSRTKDQATLTVASKSVVDTFFLTKLDLQAPSITWTRVLMTAGGPLQTVWEGSCKR